MNKIKEARQAAGLTQQQMSDQFEIPKRTIESWETGDRKPPAYVEKLIVEKLEIIKRIRIKRGELLIGEYKPNKDSQTDIEEIISKDYFEKVQERMQESEE